MMATEAISGTIATPSISPDHHLNPSEASTHDVLPEQPVINRAAEETDIKQDGELVDPNLNSAEVSVSGGSDTEASKTDASKSQVDEKGHLRTTSTVKKFASFKPVSVNKTFLAAKGSSAAAPVKVGDKSASGAAAVQTGPSASSTLRPRLVAKTGSGLRDSAPRAATSTSGGKAGAAPDASAVWNKNRPTPPAEPKRFTDEELKQRYGIHLATRLQSDDPGKQANWADIDDDDDDWAPETIEWTDGTKITLPQADDTLTSVSEPTSAPTSLKETVTNDVVKPKSPAPAIQVPSSTAVKSSGFGSGRAGLVLKGASEKPTLVAKPPGPPTPVKSPWAPLPPVGKVAPVAIESQQQPPQQGRFSQRDPHGFTGMPPPPAKEIAADDFSRSWREGANTSRELYNSQSGRYEPVNDTRRGSMRNDARSHQPAVLQRPSPDGHPEPSAAFQTNRASQDSGYGRRRTSSNVSGGSGNILRRMSKGHEMPPPQEVLNVRRGSLVAVSDAPSSPRNYSPSGQQHSQRTYQNQQQWQTQSRASPVVSHLSPQLPHGQSVPPVSITSGIQNPPIVPYEDPIEEQKKIMRQTRELAIKRRIEEEAREDAARKERIRIKLEAMGPPPELKKKKDAPKEELSSPTQIQSREATMSITTESKEPHQQAVGGFNVSKTAEPEQGTAVVAPIEPKSTNDCPPDESNMANGSHSSRPMLQQSSQDSRSSSSWHNTTGATPDRMKPWSAAPTPQSSSMNVWGPPSSDRTLGNGTFNPELSRLPDIHQSSHPGPIGPPHPNRGGNQFQPGRGQEPYGSRPAPIGPPNRQLSMSRQDIANRAAVANSGWGSLPDRLAQEDALGAQQREQELARRREMIEQGITPPEGTGPVISETWRKVSINEDGTRGKVHGNITTVHDPSQPWKGASEKLQEEPSTRSIFEDQEVSRRHHIDPVSNQTPFGDAWRPQANPNPNHAAPTRGSRFFPSNRDVRLDEEPGHFDRPGSPSPPPPTMAGHPAYDGDIAHPHVSLPRPSPIVKLPPAPVLSPIGPPKPTTFAQAVQTPAASQVAHNAAYPSRQDYSARTHSSYQDVRRQETAPTAGGWQDRINSLIGRKNSPPKSHALAVDSASKNALELTNRQFGATVSLPALGLGAAVADDGSVESKPAAEACFEEQEMGSLPVIKVPNSAPSLAWDLAPSQPKHLPRKFQVSQVLSIEPLRFSQQIANNSETITIKIPGQIESKEVSIAVPIGRQRSNPRRGGSRGVTPRHTSSSHPRGGRGRESANGFSPPSHDNSPSSSGPIPSGRGGRATRAYGAGWGRHSSTPVHS